MNDEFEQLYNTYYMKVFSFVMTLSRNRSVAEEITQSTFVKALLTNSSHRGESSEFSWLCAIAKNTFADECRRNKRLGEFNEESASEFRLEDAVADEDFAFRIHRVLHNMDEPYKEVFQLRVFGELPFKKISELFGRTETWARVTYHRARLMIQERMEL